MSLEENKYYETKAYHLIYSELINAARYRGTLTYQEIAKIVGLPSRGSHMGHEIGFLIGGISENEVAHGRPMLSAIAVGVSGEPGEGFYSWAERLKGIKLDTPEAQRQFWRQEKEAVYETWKIDLQADK